MNLILKLFSLKTIWDACFSWLFRMSVPDEYFGCLFQMTVARLRMTVSDYCSRRIFQILVSNDFSGWLFVIPRLIRILAANPLMDISTADSYFKLSFDWLVPRLIRFWMTASYCRIMAAIPPHNVFSFKSSRTFFLLIEFRRSR